MLEKREIWIDWMRISACFMVIMVHSTEPFYLGGEGTQVLTEGDAWWVAFIDCLVRACVPLFVVASSYLQFPIHYDTKTFLKRRLVRVVIPLFFWSVIYALVCGNPQENLQDLLWNFNYSAGHLWFVYMIVGLYLLMPMLSGWAERVGKKELLFYLSICLFTTLIPQIRTSLSGADVPTIYGPTGIPNPAKYPLWGEASWNTYGLFYYMSGFIGYLLLGLYFRKFVGRPSRKSVLLVGVPSLIVGLLLSAGGFISEILHTADGQFPVTGVVGIAAVWETSCVNDAIGVAFMTLGWLIIFRTIESSGPFFSRVVLPLSRSSYGIYLFHMLLLIQFSPLFRDWLGVGTDGVLGVWTTPVEILLTAISTFISAGLISKLLRYLNQKVLKIDIFGC